MHTTDDDIYASETWTLTRKMTDKLRVTQRGMERAMLNFTRRDRWRNTSIRNATKVDDRIRPIKIGKWRWAVHVARRNDNRWTKRTTDWTPRNGRRSRGRPADEWETDLRSFCSMWRREALNREKWRQHTEAFALQWADNGLS